MVKIENISFAYSKSSEKILDSISFDIQKTHCIAILGNNGAGKSTLLKCIDRILPICDGSVAVDGKNILEMSGNMSAQNIAYVLQKDEPVNMTVFDAVLLGRKPYIKWDASDEDKKIADDIIRKMNLENVALSNVTKLSGGEVQKVMLARALTQKPKLLLLDEPTSNLDLRNQHEVLRLVRKIAQENNICVVIIIHDINLAVRYCDRFLFLKDARVFSYGGLEIVTAETIKQIYHVDVDIIKYKGINVILPLSNEDDI